jgi:molecular chaperone Hsp33
MVADVTSSDGATALRGYARYDAEAISRLDTKTLAAVDVIGSGSMAVTVDQGVSDRYQAITAIDGVSLAEASAKYFEDRDGSPALVRLAVAPLYTSGRGANAPTTQWRCGGLMMQQAANSPGDGDDEDWHRVRILAETVEHHELVDPTLASDRLLLRLFHEEGVRIEKVTRVSAQCRCSRQRILDVLKSFGRNELADMPDAEGRITVTCEFCAAPYVFEAVDIL